MSRYPLMRALNAALQGEGGLKVVLLLRLSPLIPFSALNYVLSVTAISTRAYVVALVGIIPGKERPPPLLKFFF